MFILIIEKQVKIPNSVFHYDTFMTVFDVFDQIDESGRGGQLACNGARKPYPASNGEHPMEE
jgi:hypothetical protein